MEDESNFLAELKRRNVLKVATAYAVASFVILQMGDILIPALELEDSAIRYVVIALVLLFPVTIGFAWFFEVTPKGLAPASKVQSDKSISSQTGKRIDRLILLLVPVALLIFVSGYFLGGTSEEIEPGDIAVAEADEAEAVAAADTRPSVAVLPFVNMSSDKENEYFSDGLSEELLNVLAQIQGMRVAGRTSSFFYKGKNENLTEIGIALGVDNILEGSVRKSGDKVRITAQLISASDGFHLWSKTFDREMTDIFVVQDEIASEVARAMRVTLLDDGVRLVDSTTANSEAHEIYLRAKEALYSRQKDQVQHAIDLFERASVLDPEYGPPLVDYAAAQMILFTNNNIGTLLGVGDRAAAALKKAEAIGYTGSDYYATLGLYHEHMMTLDQSHRDPAEENFRRAIELNPNNVSAYIWLATLLAVRTDPPQEEIAVKLLEQALALDPLNRVANGNKQTMLLRLHRPDEAEANLKRLIDLDPDYQTYKNLLTGRFFSSGRLLEGAEMLFKSRDEVFSVGWVRATLQAYRRQDLLPQLYDQIPVDHPNIEFLRMDEKALYATDAEIRAEAEVLLLQADPDNYAGSIIDRLFLMGEFELIKELIENSRPELAARRLEAQVNLGLGIQLDYLKAIYLSGQRQRAEAFALSLLDHMSDRPYGGGGGLSKFWWDAIPHLVLGNSEAAVRDIELAAEAGVVLFDFDQMAKDPLTAQIAEMPRYLAVRQAVAQRLEPNKAAVLDTLVRAGYLEHHSL